MIIAGLDESGKGDYFGPLVAAAVALKGEEIAALDSMGLKDSKRHSRGRIRELARSIRKFHHSVVLISPAKYNQLYERYKNMNLILAWAHSQSLENLLKETPVDLAILDKFSRAGEFARALKKKRLKLEIMEEEKGEQYIPVAAASVLARDAFVSWMERASRKLGFDLPLGSSSPRVKEVACKIVEEHGAPALGNYAKLHFKITSSLPCPVL